MKKLKKKKLKGFTLVELVIVIAIIAILISLALPQYTKAKLSAIVSTHNANVQTLKSAAIMADMDNEGDNLTESTKEFLEGGEYPDIPSEIGSTSWSVNKTDNQILVEPGLVELNGTEIVPVGN